MKSPEIDTPLPFPHLLTNGGRVRPAAGIRRLTWVGKGPGVSFKKLREEVACAVVKVCS